MVKVAKLINSVRVTELDALPDDRARATGSRSALATRSKLTGERHGMCPRRVSCGDFFAGYVRIAKNTPARCDRGEGRMLWEQRPFVVMLFVCRAAAPARRGVCP